MHLPAFLKSISDSQLSGRAVDIRSKDKKEICSAGLGRPKEWDVRVALVRGFRVVPKLLSFKETIALC
jgi:hypothetical protein